MEKNQLDNPVETKTAPFPSKKTETRLPSNGHLPGWISGGLVLLAYLAWLTLPSRIPALALLLLALLVAIWGNLARLRLLAQRFANAEYIALAVILALAVALRFLGIKQSLPYLDNPDEPTMVNAAIQMLQTGDLNPHFFRWPSLPFYTQFGVSLPQYLGGVATGQFNNLGQIVPDGFYLAGRLLSATLGVATVFLTYLIGRKLYNPLTGLLAAFILTILPLHSEHSRYVTPDIMVTFFCTLTIFFAANLYRSGEKKWYIWAGIATGLTAVTKYNVAVVLVTVVLAHFLAAKEKRGKLGWLGLTFLVAGGVFLLTSPFILFDLTGFLNEMAFQVRHYTIEGHGTASEGASWQAYLGYLFDQAFVYQGIIAVMGGILLALVRQKAEDWLVLSLPAAGYFFFSSAIVHFPRNLLPLLPPLALLVAGFIIWLAEWLTGKLSRMQPGNLPNNKSTPPQLSKKIAIMVILTAILLNYSGLNSFLTTRYYLQPDTRVEAGNWLVQNIPPGKKLRMERNTPYLPADRYQAAGDKRPIGAQNLDWYRQQGYDYLVASSYEYKELISDDPQAAQVYQELFEKGNLVKEFPGDSSDHPGPTIKIYKVK